jgi:hypothetical protein
MTRTGKMIAQLLELELCTLTCEVKRKKIVALVEI